MIAGIFIDNDKTAGPITAYTIVRGGKTYVWTSESNKGFTSATSSLSNTSQSSIGTGTRVTYSCQAWIPNTNKFTVPNDITFTPSTS